ncbi:hypothetical protein FH972_024729 [Carpinus fangiana]|uniref:Carrier domain-containing protein n=1 Tax=Carpinus fangiana TaxID=176857 RepID=A0A5N6KZ68_9ROSI|nr:hypothetical protein FH972_024729 [Carpinus fangiana]
MPYISSSVPVALPDNATVSSFCKTHNIDQKSLYSVGWAVILKLYFDSSLFILTESRSSEPDATPAITLLEYRSDLSESATSFALRTFDRETDQVLFKIDTEAFDFSIQKIWTTVTINADSRTFWQDESAHTPEVDNVARTFSKVIESMIKDPERTLSQLEVLSELDNRLLSQWSKETPTPNNECLHHLFEASAHLNPEKEAIVSWDGRLSYKELDQITNKLARLLVDEFRLGPESIVPLCFEKSIWAVITMIAVLKSGASYACMDPQHPADRKEYMVRTIEAEFVLTSALNAPTITSVPAIIVDESLLSGSRYTSDALHVAVRPDNACIVAFTSGTTGNPKSFVHEHVSMCTGILSNAPLQGLNSSDIRLFQWAAYTFDVSITEIYAPLIFGATVCIPSEEERLNNVEEAMNRMAVNWAYFTPSFARFFRRYSVPGLKRLILGGEAVTVDDVRGWVDKVPVFNAYGPAESTIWFLEPQYGKSETISIGKPVNTLAWIVQPNDVNQLVPVGAIGELLFEGYGLFREYIKNPQKTQDSLIEPPTWRSTFPNPGCKLYKSGDLVRYLPDGTMTYVGRKDTMVKLRGQRMEIEEVEVLLRRNLPDEIQSSAAVVIPSGEVKDPVLVAFLCIPDENKFGTVSEIGVMLQRELAKAFPGFMVPKIYVPIPEMPYNASRKLDRSKLKHMASKMTLRELASFVRPRKANGDRQELSKIQKTVRQLWADVLSVDSEHIGPKDNFFSLGGTSMAALKITAMGRERGIAFSYRDIFRTASLEELSEVTKSCTSTSDDIVKPFSLLDANSISSIKLAGAKQACTDISRIRDIYPALPQQEGLWALSLAREGDYMAQFILSLNDAVDVDRFLATWKLVVQRYPIFQTRFMQHDGQTYQVVIDEEVEIVKSSSMKEYLQADTVRRMDFGDALMRYALIEAETEKPRFVWTAHHATYDGQSLMLFLNNLADTYESEDAQPIQGFQKFVQYVQKEDEATSIEFWRSQFHDTVSSHFPSPSSDLVNPSSVYNRSIQFSRKLSSRITTSTILQSAWQLAVAQASQSADISYGVVLAGRTAPVQDIQTLVAPTFVTLPIRAKFTADQTVEDFLKATQSGNIDMMPFEHTGIQKIRRMSSQCFDACQFQNVLIIQPEEDCSFERLFQWDDSTGGLQRANNFPLMWICYLTGEGVEIAASFDKSFISEPAVSDLAHSFESFIHLLCLEEDTRLLSSVSNIKRWYNNCPAAPKPVSETRTSKKSRSRSSSPEHTVYELALRKALAKLLSITPGDVDMNTSFLSHGGDSILAMHLMATLKSQAMTLSVHQILQPCTLRELAPLMQSKGPKVQRKASVVEEPTSSLSSQFSKSHNEVPLILATMEATSFQKQVFHSQKSNPNFYQTHTEFGLSDRVTFTQLQQAWEEVVSNNDILRTVFLSKDDENEVLQVILHEHAPTIKVIRCQESQVLQVLRLVPAPRYGPFEPRHAITARVNDSHTVSHFRLDIDHSLMDGTTFILLCHQLEKALRGNKVAKTPSMAPIIEMQKQATLTPSFHYWNSYISKMKAIPIGRPPFDFANATYHSHITTMDIAGQVATFCKLHQITSAALFRYAWANVLKSISSSPLVGFGYLVSSRDPSVDGAQEMMGPLCHILPCRFDMASISSNSQGLSMMQNDSLMAIEHQQVPLSEVCPKDVTAKAYFTTIINHRRFAATATDVPLLKDFGTYDPMDYEIVLAIQDNQDKVEFEINYWSPIITDERAKHVGCTFAAVLTEILQMLL